MCVGLGVIGLGVWGVFSFFEGCVLRCVLFVGWLVGFVWLVVCGCCLVGGGCC